MRVHADAQFFQNDAKIQRCTSVVVRDHVYHHDWYITGSVLRISNQYALVGFLHIHHHFRRLVRPNWSYSGHDKHPTWTECLYVSLANF